MKQKTDNTQTRKETMTTQTQWDTQDDYYYIVNNNIELNLRAYNKTTLHLWIYDHDNNIEIIDDDLSSIDEIDKVLQKNLQLHIDLPSIDQLLQLQQEVQR